MLILILNNKIFKINKLTIIVDKKQTNLLIRGKDTDIFFIMSIRKNP